MKASDNQSKTKTEFPIKWGALQEKNHVDFLWNFLIQGECIFVVEELNGLHTDQYVR